MAGAGASAEYPQRTALPNQSLRLPGARCTPPHGSI